MHLNSRQLGSTSTALSVFRTSFVAALGLSLSGLRAESHVQEFRTVLISEEFRSEGACFADIDSDGTNDIVSGPFWYRGPEFSERIRYAPGERFPIKAYSEHFFSFSHDFNSDGRADILVIPMPGATAHWYENPGHKDVLWKKHKALDGVDNESPTLIDINGDGRPELVCNHGGSFGYAEPDWTKTTSPWKFTPVSDQRGYGRFTHGLGVGDVNGDGRMDLLETHGWWEQTATKGQLFRFHAVRFAQAGGAQMFAYDFDGDGDNDVVSTQNAHTYGLSWFEQNSDAASVSWTRHDIVTDRPDSNPYGLVISQMHAVSLVDMDGDGVKDIVTGKRFYAHGGGDPGSKQLPVLYWFRTVREITGVRFEPWLINLRAGVGTQLTVGDIDGNGHPDVLVGNKLGTLIAFNSKRELASSEYESLRPRKSATRPHTPGTNSFARHVRETDPLTPAEELRTFILPAGFEARLVAAEPDIAKPMNLAFDVRGRLWVSSSLEYPYAAPKDRKGRDTIKILEDHDGDGHADIIKTFADGLNIPMGLYPYRDGVICFSIPDIWFLRDTDGDDRADVREKLYGPFGYERDTHGMINGFTRGLDGWLYACHGFNNISDVTGRDGHSIQMQSGNTFRIQLDGSRIEHFTHGQVNPFGMAVDRFNDFFTADCHTKPISLLLEGGYHESFGKPHDGLGFVPVVMDHLHDSTAIGGIALGQATCFPEIYTASSFGGNVMTCRVNRNSLVYNGSSPRAQEEPDFLISGDPWFRPVDLTVGPDGALYIADFYNRIIGHYEVALTHPGRDRHRGRIWRIQLSDGDSRRDPLRAGVPRASTARAEADVSKDSLETLLVKLESDLGPRSALIVDRIVESFAEKSAGNLRHSLRSPRESRVIHALWALHRTGSLSEDDLDIALQSKSDRVRVHAVQVLAARRVGGEEATEKLLAAFRDTSPRVRRAAVTASVHLESESLIGPLFDLYDQTPEEDRQLRHAIRLSARAHLRNESWFQHLSEETLTDRKVQMLAELCLALRSRIAGQFIVRHIDLILSGQPSRSGDYVSFAARYLPPESIGKLTAIVRSRFSSDTPFQLGLLDSIHTGLEQRGEATPPEVRSWAIDLAERLLGRRGRQAPDSLAADEHENPLNWTHAPHPGGANERNPWQLTRRRDSADGVKATPLYSSIPRGEKLTGIYRSDIFVVADEFSFFLAGHDGPPDGKAQGKNFVRLRDAKSLEILQTARPPRNDTARRVRWDTSAIAGRKVFVELVDGDAGSAFAWLAAGRFSEKRLNASRVPEERRIAAHIVKTFGLSEFSKTLGEILLRGAGDRETTLAITRALASLNPDSRFSALAEAPGISGLDPAGRRMVLETLASRSLENTSEILELAFQAASSSEQTLLAEKLSADGEGVKILLALMEKGKASAELLRQPSVASKLQHSARGQQKERLEELASELPPEDARIEKLISDRKMIFLKRPGSANRGKELFTKNCAICHQVAGVGQTIAPNLDGIGGRGLDRLIEDVLAPNRNVDVAFRSTTIVTHRGEVISGLLRRTEGARKVIALSDGKELAVPTSSIAQEEVTRLSPMPANIAEILNESEFNDLLSYLLSLREN